MQSSISSAEIMTSSMSSSYSGTWAASVGTVRSIRESVGRTIARVCIAPPFWANDELTMFGGRDANVLPLPHGRKAPRKADTPPRPPLRQIEHGVDMRLRHEPAGGPERAPDQPAGHGPVQGGQERDGESFSGTQPPVVLPKDPLVLLLEELSIQLKESRRPRDRLDDVSSDGSPQRGHPFQPERIAHQPGVCVRGIQPRAQTERSY